MIIEADNREEFYNRVRDACAYLCENVAPLDKSCMFVDKKDRGGGFCFYSATWNMEPSTLFRKWRVQQIGAYRAELETDADGVDLTYLTLKYS